MVLRIGGGDVEEFVGKFTIEKNERGTSFIACDEKTAEFLDGAFIDWCHRGYFEPKTITEDGRIRWILTPWGKEHIKDIIKVRGNEGLSIPRRKLEGEIWRKMR